MKKFIVVRFSLPGIHVWSECDIDEVFYLKHPHRHLFYFEARAEVTENNREIEFIKLQAEIRAHLVRRYWSESIQCLGLGGRSCESIAEELLDAFPCLSQVSVYEDFENGALLVR